MELDRHQEFVQVDMKRGETVFSYMFRLEDLAQAAFPDIEIEKNDELRKKLMRTAPPAFVAKIKEQSWLKAQTGSGYLTWGQVKVLASFREDNQAKKRERGRDLSWSDSEEREIANITVTEGKRREREPRRFSNEWRQSPKKENYGGESPKGSRGPRVICRWCQQAGHIEKECWRKQGACLACGRRGHIAVECPVKPLPPRARGYNYQTNRGSYGRGMVDNTRYNRGGINRNENYNRRPYEGNRNYHRREENFTNHRRDERDSYRGSRGGFIRGRGSLAHWNNTRDENIPRSNVYMQRREEREPEPVGDNRRDQQGRQEGRNGSQERSSQQVLN